MVPNRVVRFTLSIVWSFSLILMAKGYFLLLKKVTVPTICILNKSAASPWLFLTQNFCCQARRPAPKSAGSYQQYKATPLTTPVQTNLISHVPPTPILTSNIIWVVGGPGSNKLSRVLEVMKEHPTWGVIQTGMTSAKYCDLEKISFLLNSSCHAIELGRVGGKLFLLLLLNFECDLWLVRETW